MPRVQRQSPQPVRAEQSSRPTGGPAVAGGQYEVKKGDTLWKIAEQAYGDGRLWTLIRDANPGQVKMKGADVAIIQPGARLNVPEQPAAAQQARGWAPKGPGEAPRGPTGQQPVQQSGGPGPAEQPPTDAVRNHFTEAGQRMDQLRSQLNQLPRDAQAELMQYVSGQRDDVRPELRPLADAIDDSKRAQEESLRALSPEDQLAVAKMAGPGWANQLANRLHDLLAERDALAKDGDVEGANKLDDLVRSLLEAAGDGVEALAEAYAKRFGGELEDHLDDGLPPAPGPEAPVQQGPPEQVEQAPVQQAPQAPVEQAPAQQQPQAPVQQPQPQAPVQQQQPQAPVQQQPQAPVQQQPQAPVGQQPQPGRPGPAGKPPERPEQAPGQPANPPGVGQRQLEVMRAAMEDGKISDAELRDIVAAAKADISSAPDAASAYYAVANRLTDLANRVGLGQRGQAAVNEVFQHAKQELDARDGTLPVGTRQATAMQDALRDGKISDPELRGIVDATKAELASAKDVGAAYDVVANRLTDLANRTGLGAKGQAAVNEVFEFAKQQLAARQAAPGTPATPPTPATPAAPANQATPTAPAGPATGEAPTDQELARVKLDILNDLRQRGATPQQMRQFASQLEQIDTLMRSDPAMRGFVFQQLSLLRSIERADGGLN